MRTITVKGTGNVSARPDYIILSLNIETLSKTYDRAMSEATERIERLQGAAVRVGYRKEDLKTTSFDVQTRYENVKDRQGNYKREFAGYACSYRLKLAFVPFPVSWTVKMKKKQKETQDILSYHTQAAGCSDKARAKASGGRQPIEECGRTGL